MAGWRARRLLADQPLPPEHGWLPVLECWGTTASERDPHRVAAGARQAIAVGRACGDRDLELLGISFEGLALVEAGRIADGMARLDEAAAAATAGELDEPLWSHVVFCNVINACERVRDFARAAEWRANMGDQADRMRHVGSQGICRAHYGAVLTQCGDWAGAEDALAEAVRRFEASWPPYGAEVLTHLAELRRRQRRLGDADQLLDAAAAAPRAALVRARCALDLGQGGAAVAAAERYLRQFPETGALHRVEGLEVLVRASVAAGQRPRAEAALGELEATARTVGTPPLLAMASAARAVLAAVTGRAVMARTGFEDAIDLYARAGMGYDAAAIAYWWAEYSTVGYPDFARARIAEEGMHLWPAARLFARLAVDNFDALVSAWDAKYTYASWCPDTAIEAADDDGNPAASADADRQPEMTTPPHPDYPATLSTLCAGGAEILKDAFGDDVPFTRASGRTPEGTPETRTYDTLDAAVESCMRSRIYNGFHFRSGLEGGVEMGRERAAHILETHLSPRPEASGITFPD